MPAAKLFQALVYIMISHSKTITTLATDYTQKINNEMSLDGLQSLARVEHSNFQD